MLKPTSLDQLLECINKYVAQEEFEMFFKDHDFEGPDRLLVPKKEK